MSTVFRKRFGRVTCSKMNSLKFDRITGKLLQMAVLTVDISSLKEHGERLSVIVLADLAY